jgi:hypothetical protein
MMLINVMLVLSGRFFLTILFFSFDTVLSAELLTVINMAGPLNHACLLVDSMCIGRF